MKSTISGYEVKVIKDGIPYTLITKVPFKGFNVPCFVFWTGIEWIVEVNGEEIPVGYARCDLKTADNNAIY